jgi:hypothetical protein
MGDSLAIFIDRAKVCPSALPLARAGRGADPALSLARTPPPLPSNFSSTRPTLPTHSARRSASRRPSSRCEGSKTLVRLLRDAEASAPPAPPPSPPQINGRTYTLVRLLGEGGFSFVYLVRDMSSGREFAIKKIRCTTADQVKVALAEVEAMRRFKSPHIIRGASLSGAVAREPDC